MRISRTILLSVALLANIPAAAQEDGKSGSDDMAENLKAIARIRSVDSGTAFIFHVDGRKAYLMTAAHVLGPDEPGPAPRCEIDFGIPEQAVQCRPLYRLRASDLAIVEADFREVHTTLHKVRFGSSQLLSVERSGVYTFGYPGGGAVRRQLGYVAGDKPLQLVVTGIQPHQGQSGSPVFSDRDGKVVGVLLERARPQQEQTASAIDYIRLLISGLPQFRDYTPITVPPAGATGPLVPSDSGVSLVNAFANAASPRRWFDRSKRYFRVDADTPVFGRSESWLGVQRTYISSYSKETRAFGRGWSSSYDYRVDIAASSLCNIYLWNPRGVRIQLQPLYNCKELKHMLAPYVNDRAILDRPLAEILASDEIIGNVLPGKVSYVGADLSVLRATFIPQGIEVTTGEYKYHFNTRGRLRQVRAQGKTMDLDYDQRDRLRLVRDGDETQEFQYTDAGLVERMRFNDGAEYVYTYDRNDNLESVALGGRKRYTYRYDNRNLLVSAVLHGKDDETKQISVEYNELGERKAVTRDRRRYEWRVERDDSNEMPVVVQLLKHGDEVTDTRRYEFDYQEKRLRMTSKGVQTDYEMTACLCLPLTVKQGDRETAYRYDPFGRLVGMQAGKEEIRQTFDARFNKISRIESLEEGKWVVQSDIKYDDFGNLLEVKSPEKHLSLGYDSNRRVLKLTDYKTPESAHFKYNRMGKPIDIRLDSGGSMTVTYEPDGEIAKVESDGGHKIALKVTQLFSELLAVVKPATNSIKLDTRYALITSEPGGCDECGKWQGD